MKIITTHLSADFDAFASAICAQRLYPEHKILFSGSLEASVRRFQAKIRIPFEEVHLREVRNHQLQHALILDTQDSSRLGEVWDLIRRAECPFTRIDHHSKGDLPAGHDDIIRATGSTSTLITELFKKRGINPTPEEASLLLLGIYEDTGSLSFRETSIEDFLAVAWLLEQGGELRWIREWLFKALGPEQLRLLSRLVQGAEERIIASIPIVISTLEVEDYPEEAAAAVHQWIDAFRLPVVGVLLVRPPNIRLILRSRLDEVDVAAIAGEFGGGGHATAASARIRDRMAVEVRDEVFRSFRRQLPGPCTAGDSALRQIFQLERRTSIAGAAENINQWRINACPVFDTEEGNFCGTITRQILDRSMAMGMEDRSIETVMQPGVATIPGETPLEEVGDFFFQTPHRFVIVTRNDEAVGLLTRMEVFRRLFHELPTAGRSLDNRMASIRPRTQNVETLLRQHLPSWASKLLESIREMGRESPTPVYLVGGAVRDLLLGREIEDLDLVVEGDGIATAKTLAKKLGGRCHPHEPFLTAVVVLPDGHSIDVASARTEFYSAPAALPNVILSLIRQDLYRRDFTINTLAISLSGKDFGSIIDFFGGRKDLEERQIRVLHSLSFIDDPTRALRAIRYARRLDFEISRDTGYLIRTAEREGVFDRLSAHRLRSELEILLSESHPADSIALLAELSLLRVINPSLQWSSRIHSLLLEVQAQQAWFQVEALGPAPSPLLLYLGALLVSQEILTSSENVDSHWREQSAHLLARLQLTGEPARRFQGLGPETLELLKAVQDPSYRSRIDLLIQKRGSEALLIAMAAAPLEQRRRLADAAERGYRLEMPVRGRDLIRAGIKASPAIGKALAETRKALLDEVITGKEAFEYALARARQENRS